MSLDAAKLVPLTYGINKLQICCVVEDKVSIDLLTEEIKNLKDLVLSVDIAAFKSILEIGQLSLAVACLLTKIQFVF